MFKFKFLKNKKNQTDNFGFNSLIEKGLLTKEEVLRIKKDRAIKEWEDEIGFKTRKAR